MTSITMLSSVFFFSSIQGKSEEIYLSILQNEKHQVQQIRGLMEETAPYLAGYGYILHPEYYSQINLHQYIYMYSPR